MCRIPTGTRHCGNTGAILIALSLAASPTTAVELFIPFGFSGPFQPVTSIDLVHEGLVFSENATGIQVHASFDNVINAFYESAQSNNSIQLLVEIMQSMTVTTPGGSFTVDLSGEPNHNLLPDLDPGEQFELSALISGTGGATFSPDQFTSGADVPITVSWAPMVSPEVREFFTSTPIPFPPTYFGGGSQANISFSAVEPPLPPGWINDQGGDFHDGANWNPGVPAADEDAVFGLDAAYTVTFDADAVVDDLDVEAGEVTFDYGSRKIVTSDLSVAGADGGSASLDVGSGAGVVLTDHGLVAESITVGGGGELRNGNNAQLFVGYGDFPPGDPNNDRANTDLRALQGLRVENGGFLQTPNAKVDGPAYADGTGVATVTIDGEGSTWRALSLDVGQSHTGLVEISDGGSLIGVDTGSEALGIDVESPNAESESLIRVTGASGPGNPSTLRAASITLGIDHVARLEAVDGASVAADILRLAIRPMARGTALFRGAGTRFEGANGEFGRIKVADGGYGQLDIEEGAVVQADVVIGDTSVFAPGDNRGFVNLSGSESRLVSNELTVGRQSHGELNISGGAKATATIARIPQFFHGDGTVNVSGVGSELTVGLGGLHIGSSMGDATGVLNISDGAVVDVIAEGLGSTNIDSAGTINLSNGGQLRSTTLQSIGTISIQGTDSHLTTDIGFVGEGSTVVIDGGQLTNREEQFELRESDTMTVLNGGRVNTARWVVGVGSTVLLSGPNTVVNLDPALSSSPAADPTLQSGEGLVVGVVNISDGARIESQNLFVAHNGVVLGDEGIIQVAAGGALVNDGSIEQGTSPGTLTIEGDFVQSDLGRIVVEIAGATPDVLHDQLIVTGDATIDGAIVFSFIDGFAPIQGDTFDFMNVAGTTDLGGVEFEVANLAPGFEYDITAVGGAIQMTALNDGVLLTNLPGDYNNDGVVDAADYTVWRDNEDAPEGALLNDFQGGAIGQAQYDEWVANFGATLPPFSGSVPEPLSLTLLIFGGLGWTTLGRR